ncbi:MAG: SRPBCC domain-containing protein [Nitrososphaera sp.]
MAKEIRTEVEIAASARKVWEIISDFAKYEEWNPFIRQVSGQAVAGTKLEIHITTPSGVNRTYEPMVTKVEPEKELRWMGKVPGLLNGEHVFSIEQIDAGRTRLVHSEIFCGLLSSFFGSKTDRDIRQGLEQMNLALKKRAEG